MTEAKPRARLRRRGYDVWSEGVLRIASRCSGSEFLTIFAGTGLLGLGLAAGLARSLTIQGTSVILTPTASAALALAGIVVCLICQVVAFLARCEDWGCPRPIAWSVATSALALCALSVALSSTWIAMAGVGLYLGFGFLKTAS